MNNKRTIVVIGGGAAGFFGAIASAEANPQCRVILLEKARQVLAKVRISGGGRCNVTHACFDPAELVKNYPRGQKELRGPFSRFQPSDTVQWFEGRGVALKTESDGRMFPTTDSSETIINCLMQQIQIHGVELWTEKGVVDCQKKEGYFHLTLSDGQTLICERVLIATGSSAKVYSWLEKLGHTIVPAVPSLFTFNIPEPILHEIAGVSVPKVRLTLADSTFQQVGPLLVTHWGLSGPAVLKLSAWAARFLHEKKYAATLKIDWMPDLGLEDLKNLITNFRMQHPTRLISSESPVPLPKNLWKALLSIIKMPQELRWTVLSKQQLQALISMLQNFTLPIAGKSTYKEEFVTSGGVSLQDVNFKTMESRLCSGLYFAGEVLDIDGVTGGFNFQNAWTTSWLAGNAMAQL